jgi:hypothetical protein
MLLARYAKRLIFLVDIVGIIGIFGIVVGFFYQEDLNLKSSWAGFISNLGVELVGTWISIRVIEYIFRIDEEYRTTRVKVVRNMRWCVGFSRNLRAKGDPNTLDYANKEIEYIKHVFPIWKKFLDDNEINDCKAVYEKFYEIIKLAELTLSKHAISSSKYTNVNELLEKAHHDFLSENNTFSPSNSNNIMKISKLQKIIGNIWNINSNTIDSSRNYLKNMQQKFQDALNISDTLSEELHEGIKEFSQAMTEAIELRIQIAVLYIEIASLTLKAEKNIREETPDD